MSSPYEKINLLSLDEPLKNAFTELALIAEAQQPFNLLTGTNEEELSADTQNVINRYPQDGDYGPYDNFFNDLYEWEVLEHEDCLPTSNFPSSVGEIGQLLTAEYFSKQLS